MIISGGYKGDPTGSTAVATRRMATSNCRPFAHFAVALTTVLRDFVLHCSFDARRHGHADAAALTAEQLASQVTILYSSDTGHAEECAKAVALLDCKPFCLAPSCSMKYLWLFRRQCRNGGYASSASQLQ